MDKKSEDKMIVAALTKRFIEYRLPRALHMEKRVLKGEILNNSDLCFLEHVLNDSKYIFQYSDKYPEYQETVTKGIRLYEDILEKALENEKKNNDLPR